MTERLFIVGQSVRLKRWWGRSRKLPDTYHIVGYLPPRNNSFQYRMRSHDNVHERVTTEDEIEEVLSPTA